MLTHARHWRTAQLENLPEARERLGGLAPDHPRPGPGHGVIFPEHAPAQLSSGLLLHFLPRPPVGASMGLVVPTKPPSKPLDWAPVA